MKSHTLTLTELIVAREDAALTKPISLELSSGEMLVIHGSNGSGKSTLLKMIAGLLPVKQGAIRMNGGWPVDPAPLYLGHQRGLTPSMSVYDNVSFWAKATGFPELTAAALHYFDLEDVASTRVENLSAGWQQRVALTRLITQPSILWLLDEPTANLDVEGMGLLQSLMQSRLSQGGIILVASHLQLQGESIRVLQLDRSGVAEKVAA